MPVVKRLVLPIHCSRAEIPKGTKNDLEAVAVNTLSSVILQLSSLAKHAEGIFSELFVEANNIHERTVGVQKRIEHLSLKITKLDSAGEEISLQEINMQKAFKLTVHSHQQVISHQTMPQAMMDSYSHCEPVPNLALLSQFRHDGKDALKFYTDPSYFFELWKEKMSAEFEKRRRKRRKDNRGKKRDVERREIKKLNKKDVSKNIPDWEIQGSKDKGNAVISTSPEHADTALSPDHHSNRSSTSSVNKTGQLSPRRMSTKRASNASGLSRPSSAPPPPPPPGGSPARSPSGPPPPPPPPVPGQQYISPQNHPDSPPPPPPSMLASPSESFPPPYQPNQLSPASVAGVPQPPPPPPPPGVGPPPPPGVGPPPTIQTTSAPPPLPAGSVSSSLLQSVALKAPKHVEPIVDERNDLLSAIKTGMNLRKTQQITREEKKQSNMGNDVASILARRIAVEFSDSEDDSDISDDDWSDEE